MSLLRADVLAVEADRARGRLHQPAQQTRSRALSAPGLADDAERLALDHVERNAIDGLDRADLALDQNPALDREVLDQLLDLNEVRHGPASVSALVSAVAVAVALAVAVAVVDWPLVDAARARSDSGVLPARSPVQIRSRTEASSRHATEWPGSPVTGVSRGSTRLWASCAYGQRG
jgi:hypothetical protein